MHKGLDILAEQAALAIAKKIDIETLESRNSDELDFHELSVWQIKHALKQAYKAGFVAAIGSNLEV